MMQVGVDGTLVGRDGPEKAAIRDAGVKVVELMIEVNLTLVEIQSDELERAVVAVAVLADVLALHEALVGTEEQRGFLAAVSVGPDAGSQNAA
jgi:hypothetical protein